ncbi:MAG: glycosyltransferase family 2 protein [Acidimicrobiales bacterium]
MASPPEPQEVSAVIVNYNARAHLLACVAALRSEGVDDVVVADNASADGSLAALATADPDAVLIATGANLGYGSAANRGAVAARGQYLLVGNSDLVVQPGAVAALRAALDAEPGLGIVGPRIENADGGLYPSARRFPSPVDAAGHALLGLVAPANPFTRRYRMLDWDHAASRPVDWVSGACFLARRRAWEAVGGFDPAYFMYAEDVDLCWRSHRAGWGVAYEPAAVVVHAQGVSAGGRPYRMIAAHHRSALRFAARSATGGQRALLPLVAAGLALRMGLAAAREAVRQRVTG